MTIGDILHFIIEQIAIDAGILLSNHDIKEAISKSEMSEWVSFFDKNQDEVSGVRPEFIEDIVRVLRVALGNLPDATSGLTIFMNKITNLHKRGIDTNLIINAFDEVVFPNNYKTINKDILEKIISISKQNPVAVIEFIEAIGEYQNRSFKFRNNYDVIEWDGGIELSKLFNGEIIPENPEIYFDQRFLDYLAKNEGQLEMINWRNFERLCAEFFKRKGFIVKLSPPTKDGGIDIRIWSEKELNKNPPLIVIQCKRYKKSNKVEIEYIKALWADLTFENAKKGLLATTSHIAPGGVKICKVRKWPLSFAENENVKKWIKSMWRYKPELIKKSKGIGKYLLPPFTLF